MVNKVLLISGPISMVNDISKSFLGKGAGIYGMSMQTDKWPYINDDNRTGWIINSLTSSIWRPESMNALWKETFHTISVAISRSDNEFGVTKGAPLRQLMDAYIAAGTYYIS